MKKRFTIFILAAALVMSLPMAASAAEVPGAGALDPIENSIIDGGISVTSVSSSNIGATRNSATSGTVNAYAAFSGTATKAICFIYLQELYNGSWRAATGVTNSYSKTVYNANSITAGKTFTLISGKTYRAKIVFTDTIGGTTYNKTRYTGSF